MRGWCRKLDKGGERACTTSAASAGSVSVAAIAAAVATDATDATDAAAGSVTSAGAAVVCRLPEGVSSALTKNLDDDCRRCCLSGSPTLPLLFVNSATGASYAQQTGGLAGSIASERRRMCNWRVYAPRCR